MSANKGVKSFAPLAHRSNAKPYGTLVQTHTLFNTLNISVELGPRSGSSDPPFFLTRQRHPSQVLEERAAEDLLIQLANGVNMPISQWVSDYRSRLRFFKSKTFCRSSAIGTSAHQHIFFVCQRPLRVRRFWGVWWRIALLQ